MRAMVVLAAGILGAQGVTLPNSIGGRVTGPDGAGVAGVVITVLERTDSPGGSRIHPVNVKTHVLTDAHGDYLFTQVPLGEVFVVAIPKNAALVDGRLNRSGYGVTYYPSAARVEEALPVTVNVRAAQKADIRLTSVPLAAVGGVVFDSHDRSGRVIVPEELRGDVPRAGVTVGTAPIDSEGNPGPDRPGALKDDLTFECATWPGPHRLVVSGLPYAWRIKAVRYRGAEVTTKGIDFTGPDVVSGIEIELERGVR